MRKLVLTIFLLFMLAIPASASAIVAPPVPDDVEELIPSEDWELGNGVITILKRALAQMQPQVVHVPSFPSWSCIHKSLQAIHPNKL